jgi:hypothetical protein
VSGLKTTQEVVFTAPPGALKQSTAQEKAENELEEANIQSCKAQRPKELPS